jgi:protein gp37
MGTTTSIEWTDHTFNPWWGCTKVAPECDNCYAERDSKFRGFKVWGPAAPRRFFGDGHWKLPFKWNEEAGRAGVMRRVFCASFADVFERYETGADESRFVEVDPAAEAIAASMGCERARLFSLIEGTPMLLWLLLTKRPENISTMIPSDWLARPRRNVWFGTSVGTTGRLSAIDRLLDVPAALHFVSYEPALELVDFEPHLRPRDKDGRRLQWLIAGGESGHRRARSFHIEWARAQKIACERTGVSFFMKQLGHRAFEGLVQLGVNGKGNDMTDWPQDLCLRQVPHIEAP